MHKLQVIVTSYQRPKYLERCLESLKRADVEIFVVDGGQEDVGQALPETRKIIEEYVEAALYLTGNPGADVLKNEGIKRFVTEPEFMITSDDFIYPKGWREEVLAEWDTLKRSSVRELNGRTVPHFVMMACPTEEIAFNHETLATQGGKGIHYQDGHGTRYMTTSVSMCAGTMMDTYATRYVGGFPVYGKTGQGDIAISREFTHLKLEVGYFRYPVIQHLGRYKGTDYPQYTEDFNADDAVWQNVARYKHIPGKRREMLAGNPQ